MCLYIVSIHRNVYQNRFVKERARKKKAEVPESRTRSLVRYRRTYVLNKNMFLLTTALKQISILNDGRCHASI